MSKRNEKRILYIEPCAGLGNRLSAVVSAFYWANKYDMELHIVWKHEPPCAVDYHTIFEEREDFVIKEINQMGKKQVHILQFLYANLWLKWTRRKCRFITCEEIRSLYTQYEFGKGIEKVLEENSCVYIKSTSMFADENILQREGWYGKIPFAEVHRRLAESIIGEHPYVVGIHIRRTDHAHAIQNSPTSLFEIAMNNELENHKDVVFYLATDDKREKEALVKRYPIIQRNMRGREISRVTNDGMQDAVIDMLCLSLCAKIYGSSGSTFSKWASKLGNIPLEYITKNH